MLQAAAILGDPVLTEVLAGALQQNLAPADRRESSRRSPRAGPPASPAPPRLSFASPLHGEIVLDAIPPEARRELHAAAAATFIETRTGGGRDALVATASGRRDRRRPIAIASARRRGGRSAIAQRPAHARSPSRGDCYWQARG